MRNNESLLICESFFSVQGEGPSSGTPSVFLRLAGCNLNCTGFSFKDHNGHHLGCDSKSLWQKGREISFSSIMKDWEQNGWIEKLNQGAHLVITGGEPLLQQDTLAHFINWLDQKIFIELETNGTIFPNDFFLNRLNQINVSPKLSNSGEPFERRYNHKALSILAQHSKAIFKFVIINPNDIEEIIRDYSFPLNIKNTKIWLMPEGGNLSEITKKHHMVVELCKKHTMNFSPRLQIYLWNNAQSV